MDRENVKKAFREFKKVDGIAYSYMNVDRFGDCQSCVNAELADRFGEDSKGIFLKHWNYGMNASGRIERQDSLYISHDITEEQGNELVNIFTKYFKVFPKKYNPRVCYELFDKNAKIYEVWCYKNDTGNSWYYKYTDIRRAQRWCDELNSRGFKADYYELV